MAKLIPKYARAPILLALALNCAVFWLTRPITRNAVHYDLTLPWDRAIPLVPVFIVIYVLAFFQWLVGYVIIARDSPDLCYRVFAGEMIAKLICCAFFLLMPTVMERPTLTGTDIFSRLTGLIYALDTPDNLFPSIHCAESWQCFRCALPAKKVGRAYKTGSLVFTLLVFASVLLVKQHVLLDILGGVAAAEIGQLMAAKTGAGRLLERFNARFGLTEERL